SKTENNSTAVGKQDRKNSPAKQEEGNLQEALSPGKPRAAKPKRTRTLVHRMRSAESTHKSNLRSTAHLSISEQESPKVKMNQRSTTLIVLSTLAAVANGKTIRGGEHRRELQRNRIIGGSEAQEDRYSFAVSLQDRIGHFCGGTLISPDTVLSAAHCGGGGYDIVVGRHDHGDRDGEAIGVKKELKHPDYESDTTNNDFMLIFLDEPVSVDNVKFASVTDNFVGVSEAVTVVGWGDTDIDLDEEELADELQEVEVYTISNNECDDSEGVIDGDRENYNGQITSSMLCAEHPKRKDSCQGDSGGPLVKKSGSGSGEEFELVGVVSWGVGCAHDDFPGVYARVSAEYRWIKEEVCKRSSRPPASLGCGGGSTAQTANQPQNDLFEADYSEPEPSTASMIISNNSGSSGSWRTVMEEDFRGGFGKFSIGGKGSKHYPSAKGKSGVVRIENTSTLSSNVMSLNSGESTIMVDFSAYVVVFEEDDEFCLDSSSDGSNYSEEVCWNLNDIENKEWANVSWEFDAPSSSISIRFRCAGNHKHDDVLIDEVRVRAL
ncbi:hypothetical protein THAOC_14473, partial [Thalassiosira oceanica]